MRIRIIISSSHKLEELQLRALSKLIGDVLSFCDFISKSVCLTHLPSVRMGEGVEIQVIEDGEQGPYDAFLFSPGDPGTPSFSSFVDLISRILKGSGKGKLDKGVIARSVMTALKFNAETEGMDEILSLLFDCS